MKSKHLLSLRMRGVLLLLLGAFGLTGCADNFIIATPNPMVFGLLQPGQSKDLTLSVRLPNFPASSLAINNSDFQVVSQDCIGRTGTCSAVIRFTPTTPGAHAATLSINAASYTKWVTLLGECTAPLAAALAGADLQFDGTASRVTISHNAALNAFPLTAEMWVKTTQTADAALISKYAPGSNNGWQLLLRGGRISGKYSRDSANSVGEVTGGFVADGRWHHVTFVVDSAGGTVFIDGIVSASGAWQGTPGSCDTAQDVLLGAFSDGSAPFLGQMDEIRLWNVARTSAQIQINRQATQKENETGLLAYYRLDEGKGTATADATANHFDGTLAGNPVWTNSLAPVDTVVVTPDEPRTFRVAGFDINGTALTFANDSLPTHGTLRVDSPDMTYTPDANPTLTDTFTYTANNGTSVSNAATVHLVYRAAGANTLLVPSQYSTIQAAVNAAVTGDTILVADGTYTGAGNYNVDFGGKGLTLKSTGGSAACIIDCQQRGRGFLLAGGETGASRIEGFTIKNGYPQLDFYGGGVYAANSNPTVANCLFLNNTVNWARPNIQGPGTPEGNGGGMFGGTAVNCVFIGNRAATYGGGFNSGTAINCTFTNNNAHSGGGMAGGTATNCTFNGNTGATGGGMRGGSATNCTFTNNRVTGAGGGMAAGNATNCAFINNIANAQSGGGMLGGNATNCLFAGNSAPVGGAFEVIGGNYPGTAVNCTFVGNSASRYGGAIICEYGNFAMTNCIVWGNSANIDGSQIYLNNSTLAMTYSDVQGGWPGAGNINADPLFVDAANGDFRLTAASPCIDAGTATGLPPGITLPATDLDGNPRIIGGMVDMGAYEVANPIFLVTPNPAKFGLIRFGQSKDLTLNVTFGVGVTGTYLAIDGGANPTDFQIVSQNCIDGTGNCRAVIRFAPTAIGTRSATLTLKATLDGSLYTKTVPLMGSAAQISAGLAGAALDFSGATSYAQAQSGVYFNGDFTIEGWVYLRSYTYWSRLLDFGNGPGGDGPDSYLVIVALSDTTTGRPALAVGNPGSYVSLSTSQTIPLNTWTHLAATLSGTTGTLYINGVSVLTGTFPVPRGVVRNNCYIGRSNGSVEDYVNGQFDELRIWSKARSQAEIQADMNASLQGNETGLVAYWRLDEGKGATFADATGHGYGGTFVSNSSDNPWRASTAPIDTVHVLPGQATPVLLAGFEPGGLLLTFAPAANPMHGSLSGESPLFTYTPDSTYAGTDFFTYTATDGLTTSAPTTVKINYGNTANTVTVSGTVTLQGAVNSAQSVTFTFRPTDGSAVFTRLTTLSSEGAFTIPVVLRKAYIVHVEAAKYLAKNVSVDATNGDVSGVNATLRAGDANGDNVVDIADLMVLTAAYNEIAPSAAYNQFADFNGDGANDILDLLLLIGNYNQVGD